MAEHSTYKLASVLLLLAAGWLAAGCAGAEWLPSLTFSVAGTSGERTRMDGEQGEADAPSGGDRLKRLFRLRADARLGWALDLAADHPQTDAPGLGMRRGGPAGQRSTAAHSARCGKSALCAWEKRERERALTAYLPGLKPGLKP